MPRHLDPPSSLSVIMPVYNAEAHLAEAIAAILAQTYPHFELIIAVDDGSTDGSVGIVREFAARDTRIRPLVLPRSTQAQALNAGVALARGAWVALAEADDIALPKRFATQLEWMDIARVDIGGACAKLFGEDNRLAWFPETHEAIRNELCFRCAVHPTTAMLRADVLRAYRFDEEAVFVDYEMWTRLVQRCRMGNAQQVLAKIRRHGAQTSVVKKNLVGQDLRKFRDRYFHALFPWARPEDRAAFACVAEGEPLPDLAGLRRAGNWLARLAQVNDAFLRERMAERWLSACARSANLGVGAYRCFVEIRPSLGARPRPAQLDLWGACVLRLSIDSGPGAPMESLKGRLAGLVVRFLKSRRAVEAQRA